MSKCNDKDTISNGVSISIHANGGNVHQLIPAIRYTLPILLHVYICSLITTVSFPVTILATVSIAESIALCNSN